MKVDSIVNGSSDRCPHCGKQLDSLNLYSYSFKKWATPLFISFISVMLLLIDFAINNTFSWSPWAAVGIWGIYVPVQLLRTTPNQGWIIIPFTGVLLSFFLYFLDRRDPPNDQAWGLDWAGIAIVPIVTFLVIFPILGHIARDEPNEQERLELFIEQLEHEESKKR